MPELMGAGEPPSIFAVALIQQDHRILPWILHQSSQGFLVQLSFQHTKSRSAGNRHRVNGESRRFSR